MAIIHHNSQAQSPRQAGGAAAAIAANSRPLGGARQRVEQPKNCAKPYPAQRGLVMLSTSDTEGVTWEPATAATKARKAPYQVEDLSLHAIQVRALRTGADFGFDPIGGVIQPHLVWNISGKGRYKCVKPVAVNVWRDAKGDRFSRRYDEAQKRFGSEVNLMTRCRKCDPCLKARSAFWKLRAMAEIQAAPRTWFVTLTFNPEMRVRADYAALQRLTRRQSSTEPKDLFQARWRYLAPHVTRWLKRVRKGHAAKKQQPVAFRYLLVVEEHKDGFPHCHLLIHERRLGDLTKRRIETNWTAGVSGAKVVGGEDGEAHKAAAYTCKYIAKSALSRIRASDQYGVNS